MKQSHYHKMYVHLEGHWYEVVLVFSLRKGKATARAFSSGKLNYESVKEREAAQAKRLAER